MWGGSALVVFDMAGTTVEDSGEVLDCFAASMTRVGLDADRKALNDSMGQSKLPVLRVLAAQQLSDAPRAEAAAQAAFLHFRVCMAERYRGGGSRPIEGARAAFVELRRRGVRVALNTGFDAYVTDALVGALGWSSLVDAIVCADDVPEGRPAPYLIHAAMQRTGIHAVREVAVLGDTPSDIAAGANAGAGLVVGVLSGAHTAASLRRYPLTHLLEGVWELPAFLARQARLAERAR